jgi:hypothetical protein
MQNNVHPFDVSKQEAGKKKYVKKLHTSETEWNKDTSS